MTQTDQRDIPYHFTSHSAIKAGEASFSKVAIAHRLVGHICSWVVVSDWLPLHHLFSICFVAFHLLSCLSHFWSDSPLRPSVGDRVSDWLGSSCLLGPPSKATSGTGEVRCDALAVVEFLKQRTVLPVFLFHWSQITHALPVILGNVTRC